MYIQYDHHSFFYTATETWCFGGVLPLLISHFIPDGDPNWNHFLQLLDIADFLFAPIINKDVPAYLLVFLEENLAVFKDIYPEATIIPKIHDLFTFAKIHRKVRIMLQLYRSHIP